jgi:hypothetical protein
MIGRFPDAGHRVGWAAGDEVYGGNPKLRAALEERQVGYVLAVACSHEVTTDAGKFRADALAAKVPKRAWQKGRASRTPSIPQSTPKALAVADRVERGSWPSRGAELVG